MTLFCPRKEKLEKSLRTMVIPCLNFNKQLTAKVEKFDLSYGFKLPTYILLNVCKYFPFPVPLSRLGRMELCYDSWLYCIYICICCVLGILALFLGSTFTCVSKL